MAAIPPFPIHTEDTDSDPVAKRRCRSPPSYEGRLIMSRYLIGRKIGDGLTAIVFEAVDTVSCTTVAVKVLQRRQLERLRLTQNVMREIQYGAAMGFNKNIVKLLDAFLSKDDLFIVFELVEGKELFQVISEQGRLTEADAKFYFNQLIEGLEYIHSKGFCHRDVKPENLLLSEKDNTLKISDFGFSRHLNSVRGTKFIGSVQYMAPELCSKTDSPAGNAQSNGYCCTPLDKMTYNGVAVDIWAAGVVLYVMLVGEYPFEDENEPQKNDITWSNIQQAKFKLPNGLSNESKELLKSILRKDPTKRPTMKEIREHPWMKSHKSVDAEPTLCAEDIAALLTKGHNDWLESQEFPEPFNADSIEASYSLPSAASYGFDNIFDQCDLP